MGFGKDLTDQFLTLSRGKPFKEVVLFETLCDCFINLKTSYPLYKITILHKNQGQVIYENAVKGNVKKRITGVFTESGKTADILGVSRPGVKFQCEISDLAFVVYSENGIKITYLQNKVEKKFDKSLKKFHIDVDQLALLKGRPVFEVKNKKSKVAKWSFNDVLYNAEIESAGSYGVFYKNSLGKYDMFYCPADLLSYVRRKLKRTRCPSTGKYKKISSKSVKYDIANIASGTPVNEKYRYYNNPLFADRLCALNLEEFGDELINFHVGTILDLSQVLGLLEFVKSSGEEKLYSELLSSQNRHGNLEELSNARQNELPVFDGARTYVFIGQACCN